MNDVDVSKIKAGDVVGVRVTRVGDYMLVCVGDLGSGVPSSVRIDPSAIVSHTPAPKPALKVGDMLQRSPGSLHRQVLWIEDGWVYFNPIDPGNAIGANCLSEVETWGRV